MTTASSGGLPRGASLAGHSPAQPGLSRRQSEGRSGAEGLGTPKAAAYTGRVGASPRASVCSSVALGWQRTSRACWSTERLSDPAPFRVWPSEEDPAPHTLSSRPTQTGVLTGAALLRVALGPQTRVTRHPQGFTDVSLRPRWKPDLVTSHHLDALRKPVRSTPRRAGGSRQHGRWATG